MYPYNTNQARRLTKITLIREPLFNGKYRTTKPIGQQSRIAYGGLLDLLLWKLQYNDQRMNSARIAPEMIPALMCAEGSKALCFESLEFSREAKVAVLECEVIPIEALL